MAAFFNGVCLCENNNAWVRLILIILHNTWFCSSHSLPRRRRAISHQYAALRMDIYEDLISMRHLTAAAAVPAYTETSKNIIIWKQT